MPTQLILNQKDFKVLSSETRVSMLKLLAERRYTSTELAQKLSLSAPTIAEHLSQLQDSKLVELQDDGHKWKYYALTKKGRQLVKNDGEPENILVLLSPLLIGLVGVMLLGASLLQQPFSTPVFDELNSSAKMDVLSVAEPPAVQETMMAMDASGAGEAFSDEKPPWSAVAGVALLVVGIMGIYYFRHQYFRS